VKKLFQLTVEGRHRDRLLDASKHEVRKYVARQRRAALPEGMDYWDFACRFGSCEADATEVHFATLIALMDEAGKSGAHAFFVSIIGAHGVRVAKPKDEGGGSDSRSDQLMRHLGSSR
jgi:hypothetical protein